MPEPVKSDVEKLRKLFEASIARCEAFMKSEKAEITGQVKLGAVLIGHFVQLRRAEIQEKALDLMRDRIKGRLLDR